MAITRRKYNIDTAAAKMERAVSAIEVGAAEDLRGKLEAQGIRMVTPVHDINDDSYVAGSALEKKLEEAYGRGANDSDDVCTIELDGFQTLLFEHAGQYFLSNWFYDMQEKKLEAVTYPALRSLGVEEILSVAIWASTGADGMLSQTDTKNMAGVMEKVARMPVDIPEYDEMDIRSSIRAMILDSILDSDTLTAVGREILEKRAYDQKAVELAKQGRTLSVPAMEYVLWNYWNKADMIKEVVEASRKPGYYGPVVWNYGIDFKVEGWDEFKGLRYARFNDDIECHVMKNDGSTVPLSNLASDEVRHIFAGFKIHQFIRKQLSPDFKPFDSFKAEAAKFLVPKNDEQFIVKNVHKDVSFILSTKLPDVEIVRSNINHPDVDFVLLFVPEHGSFKSADKLSELKAIRNMAGDSLIEISVPGVGYSDPEDPTYSDVVISKKGLKGIVEQFREKLPEEYIDGKPFGVAVFCPEDICGYKANLDSSWTQYAIGSELFDFLKLSGLKFSSIVSMFPEELFVHGFSFEAAENGIPLTVSVGVKDLDTLKDESYGEMFSPSCYLNHNTREVDFATSSDFVRVDFLELLSYGKGKTKSLKSSVKSKKTSKLLLKKPLSLKVNRKRNMSGIKM